MAKKVKYYSPSRRKVYARGDDIDCMMLFELHNWQCFVCKTRINRRFRVPDWRAATIDHHVPISKGGTHTWDNIVPAHYKCNMDKSNLSQDWTPGRLCDRIESAAPHRVGSA